MQLIIPDVGILFLQEIWICLMGKESVSGDIAVEAFLFRKITNIWN